MGTNYYLHQKPCEHCGRSDEPIHIGKSSCGWVFALHVGVTVEDGLPRDLEEWKTAWSARGFVIEDENGKVVSPKDMLGVITERSHPNGLRRSPIGEYCIGHGSGTWDLHVGEFS